MFNDNNINKSLIDKSNHFDKALKIFGIPRSYDIITLKKKYIQLAFENHPDKGGDKELFSKIQLAYKILLKHIEDSNNNHDHNQLRTKFNEFKDKHVDGPVMNINSEQSFNRDKFNKAFEVYKGETSFDKGYGTWIKENKEDDLPQTSSSLKKGNFNEEIFHKEFNKNKKALNKKMNNHIIKFDEPKIDISYKGKDALSILGQGDISDFSGESEGGLSYRDYKDAFTNPTLIDIDMVDISSRSFNINDKTVERENISYELDEEGQRKESLRISDEEISEKKRLDRLRMLDETSAETYEKIHQRMLSR